MGTVLVWPDAHRALLEALALHLQVRSATCVSQGSFRLATPILARLAQVELSPFRLERLHAVRAPTMPLRTPS